MKRMLLLFIVLLSSISLAQAQHAVHTRNLNLDKSHHLAAGVALGAFDYKLGCGAGLAKELSDDVFDLADLSSTCGGALFSDWLGKDKSKLYKYNVVTILLDGISTDNAVRQGGFEVGYPRYVIGSIPSSAKIAAFTAFRLWLLNESESWNRGLKGAFQWGTAISGTLVVYGNYSIDFK